MSINQRKDEAMTAMSLYSNTYSIFMGQICKLPEDVKRHILPFTYRVQSKGLLNDISHYVKTSKEIRGFYRQYWIVGWREPASEDSNWLVNDLCRYIGGEEWEDYMYYGRSTSRQWRLIWGALQPYQRDDFIENYCFFEVEI
jgi:hypothetical protein